jgi:hypothetical protein
VGRPGEARVRHILYERLAQDHTFCRSVGAKDELGEDDKIYLDGHEYIVQIVTALKGERIGLSQASNSTACTSINLDQVARWLAETIQGKVNKTDPPRTVLALDANLLGILASEALVDAYHRAAASSFGFAAIWLVGATVDRCLRLKHMETTSCAKT